LAYQKPNQNAIKYDPSHTALMMQITLNFAWYKYSEGLLFAISRIGLIH